MGRGLSLLNQFTVSETALGRGLKPLDWSVMPRLGPSNAEHAEWTALGTSEQCVPVRCQGWLPAAACLHCRASSALELSRIPRLPTPCSYYIANV